MRCRAGEISAALERAPGAGGHQRQARSTAGTSVIEPPITKLATLEAAGISNAVAHRAEKLAANPERVEQQKKARRSGRAQCHRLRLAT